LNIYRGDQMEPQVQKKSPFFIGTVKCPICETAFQNPRFKAGLYSVIARDSDQRPVAYKWTDPEFNNILPHYFAIVRCPRCLFSDFPETFERSTHDAKMHSFKRFYKSLPLANNAFLAEITKHTEVSLDMNYEAAMNMHLTAAYIQDMPTKAEEKNYYKLARLYLRIAWLYRERYGNIETTVQPELTKNILKIVGNIETSYSKIEQLSGLLAGNIKSRVTELYGGAAEVPLNNPYYANLAAFFSNMKNMAAGLNKIKATTISDQQGKLVQTGTADPSSAYFSFNSYLDFIMYLSGYWRELPLNEKDAISLAVKYYALSYTNEDVFDTQEKRMKAVDLISELHVRLEDYDSAINYVLEIHRSGNKDRQGLYKKLNTPHPDGTPLSFIEKSRIESLIGRINSAMNKASDKRHELEEKRFLFCLPRVQEICRNNPDLAEEDLILKIEAAGIPQSVYNTAKEKNVLQGGTITVAAASEEKAEEKKEELEEDLT